LIYSWSVNFWKNHYNIVATAHSATRGQILRLKCTELFSAGAPSRNPLGELTALPQTSWLDLRGLLLRGVRGGEE